MKLPGRQCMKFPGRQFMELPGRQSMKLPGRQFMKLSDRQSRNFQSRQYRSHPGKTIRELKKQETPESFRPWSERYCRQSRNAHRRHFRNSKETYTCVKGTALQTLHRFYRLTNKKSFISIQLVYINIFWEYVKDTCVII